MAIPIERMIDAAVTCSKCGIVGPLGSCDCWEKCQFCDCWRVAGEICRCQTGEVTVTAKGVAVSMIIDLREFLLTPADATTIASMLTIAAGEAGG